MKSETSTEATEPRSNPNGEPAAEPSEDASKKPRLASIVREVEAAVRELEEPPPKE